MFDEISEIRVPEILPVLPLRNTVVFPNIIVPLIVGRERSIRTVEEAMLQDKLIALVPQNESEVESPETHDLLNYGTVGVIIRKLLMPEGEIRIIVQGLARIAISEVFKEQYILKAVISLVRETGRMTKRVKALMKNVRDVFQRLVVISPNYHEEVYITALNIDDPGKLADIIASELIIPQSEKEELLKMSRVESRLQRVNKFLLRELEMAELGSKIQTEAMTEIEKQQKDYFLRQQLKAIHDELGEDDERAKEYIEFTTKIKNAKMPEDVEEEALKELKRLRQMPPQAAEYSISRTYLETMVSLPWNKKTSDTLDIKRVAHILDQDHYNLKKIKERIIEYLAVTRLTGEMKGPIFCFIGPPGVGKTSLGMSIARALGRKFNRISLGGIRDEAEIRGHRRTYIGALPGRIIQGIIKSGSKNPIFMLDEIDKIGTDFRGDPASALLEVLDPEQNFSFSDHYLEVPFDLSSVMFITTANVTYTIPPALIDRMEILRLPGYSEEEKVLIARNHLIPKLLSSHGLTSRDVKISLKLLREIIRRYSREAGVRNLERSIASIFRKIARRITEGEQSPFVIKIETLKDYLGPQQYFLDQANDKSEVGVATGLAWTPTGGEILFVESTIMKGSKKLILTGQLGDVMKESAEAALSYIRSQANELKLDPDFFDQTDIHVHVPSGAIPKDGPSAGVAIAMSLLSLLARVPIFHDLAMTGEITLRGKVLPVGGIKEKVLAAHRAGIQKIILPKQNRGDLEDISPEVLNKTTFYFVDKLKEVYRLALLPKGKTGSV
ncbi:endopeptidase La [bacterium]|nr:endopeptidase La [bacterium]